MERIRPSSLPAISLDSARLPGGRSSELLGPLGGPLKFPTPTSAVSEIHTPSAAESESGGVDSGEESDDDGDAFVPYSPQRLVAMSPISQAVSFSVRDPSVIKLGSIS